MDRARFDAILADHGQPLSLARPNGSGGYGTAVSVRGKVFGSAGSDLVGAQQQRVRSIRIGNSEIVAAAWPGPPKRGDRLTEAGGKVWIVEDVDTRLDGTEVWCHILTVKG